MNGDRLGRIGQVYLDNDTGQPEWVTVRTGLFGSNESFVPLERAELADGVIRVPYDKDRVKEAPSIETDRELSAQDEDRLYSYYGLGRSLGTAQGTTARRTDTTAAAHVDRGTHSRHYDASASSTDDAMTRSEERVRTDTEMREAGRARLRKYVVSEQQQVHVPVTREEVRVEREPITDDNYDRARNGPALSEEEHEVVLNEERPVVTTEAVPVERVRLSKDQVQDEQTVNVNVHKEQIDMEDDPAAGRRRDDNL
jgi:uncharacterized protein (TIGR02271 family)